MSADVRVRVRYGRILYDEEGRGHGVGEELTVSAKDARSLEQAGTAERVREPDAAGKPRPRSVVKAINRKR